MRSLVLVRHSLPEIDPQRPARDWRLSEEGLRRCAPLADLLAAYSPAAIVASEERKARETAEAVAALLGLRASTATGLHEHERAHMGWMSAAPFQAAIERFFAQPDQLVLGEETASEARRRFDVSLGRVLHVRPAHTVVVVSHGTVISLLVAERNGLDPLQFWRKLGMPSFAVLRPPEYGLVEVVTGVA